MGPPSSSPDSPAFARLADLSEAERADVRALSQAVYPPAEWADWPGQRLEWSGAEWCVRLRGQDGELACYVGVVLRDALHDGRRVRLGGVGGVKTHPGARRQGHAARAIGRALSFFREQRDVDFALLVCEPRLLAYYGSLGFREFHGRLLVAQHGLVTDFTFCRSMVADVRSAAPRLGTLDLCGPPW